MAGFTPITFVFQHIVRSSLRAFLWGTDSFARLVRRRPEYNTLRLDISEPPEEEHTTSLRSLIQPQGPDLLSIMSLLRWAREDEKIRAVVLTVSGLDIGWARLQSLRRSLIALRQADKHVWVYLAEAGMREYYLASAANTIVVAPAGHLTITGLAAETMFFKGALDKLGVEAQVIQAGQYKAAGEPFTRESMSPAHREMMDGLLDDLYDHQYALTLKVLDTAGRATGAEGVVEAGIDARAHLARRVRRIVDDVRAAGAPDLAKLSVVNRQLADLAAS